MQSQRRGRGRGRGNTGPWTVSSSRSGEAVSNEPSIASVRFDEARSHMQESVKRFSGNNDNDEYRSSSEEEFENEDEILNNLITSYPDGGSGSVLGRTEEFLKNAFKSGSSVCLVCIASIKKADAVWNCEMCYGMFHLTCIQKWAKDSVFHQEQALQDGGDAKPRSSITWFCPKCRYEYTQSQKPTKYFCFCGKEANPKLDPWLLPHTCGQRCEKPLKPQCGHLCLLLCHPGPCPPCPKTVNVTCFCGQQSPQTKRCSAREWSCGKRCNKLLTCGQHRCITPCHTGECDPCPRQSLQSCECGRKKTQRPCATPKWNCDQVCGKPLPCGNHLCERVCHRGQCGQCPKSGERSCPCGKAKSTLPCTEDVPTCGDTCGKRLECGVHFCAQRCHNGNCGVCLQMRVKKCHCGIREKSVPCFKDYRCDTKCKKMRDCNRHTCNRKCCDGNCSPCEQQCARTLGCRNHKCSSACHQGPCYPCPVTVEVKCRCAATKLIVPCGREKSTKPPKCKQLCKIPPKCHHPKQVAHKCHFGECPPCEQTCLKKHEPCGHKCPNKCHTAVLTKVVSEMKRQGPWEPVPPPRFEIVKEPCPPCVVPVPVMCIGLHEVCDFPCYEATPKSCFRSCGRKLSCGNHACSLPCHSVSNPPDRQLAGDNCEVCERSCTKPRPSGCKHECPRLCHPKSCDPCRQMIKLRCHCQLNQLYIECVKWTGAVNAKGGGESLKNDLQSCKNQCPKNMACGHRCALLCHVGDCQKSEFCKKKVAVRCPCKRIKKDVACNQTANFKLECDDVCLQQQELKRKAEQEAEIKRKLEEEKSASEEMNKFLQRVEGGGKKRKHRKQREEVVEHQSFLSKYKTYFLLSIAVMFLSVFAYYVIIH